MGFIGFTHFCPAQVVVPVASGAHSGHFVPGKVVSPEQAESSAELIAVGRPVGPVREDIAIACGTTEVRPQAARRRSAARVEEDLNAFEIRLILDFLDKKFMDQSEYKSLAFNAMKNDASNILLRQPQPVEGYCNALVLMYRNPGHDYVWKGYCLQFMFSYFEKFCSGDEGGKSAQVFAVYSCLQDAVKEVRMPIAGTALCGLAALSEVPVFKDIDVTKMALQMAEDTNACVSARTTAIQVAAEAGSKDVLPLARKIAVSREDAMLRLASIGAIGLLGGKSDFDLIRELAGSGDSRISTSSRCALNRLTTRFGSSPK